MSTIDWATGISGLFSTAADWSGGVVPGAQDTAVISAGGASPYTVTISSALRLGGLQLDQALATVLVKSKLSSKAILIEAGTLTLAHGTLTGTVTQTAGTFQVDSSGGTLMGVTWQGALDPGFVTGHRHPAGTLTIAKSLTLEGAGGIGPGSATFYGPVILDGLKTLNDATIGGYGTLTVSNSTKLTLGSTLVDHLSLAFGTGGQESLINDGAIASTDGNVLTITDGGSTLGTVTNDGTLSGNITVSVESFTNNSLISAAAGQTIELDAAMLAAPGANGSIILESGNLIVGGQLTSKSLTKFYATQHVSGTGSFGFGVSGNLNNAGNTLDIGTGSIVGTLDGSAAGTLSGGTVVDLGGESVLTGGGFVYPNFQVFTLADLTYESASPTLTFADDWALTNTTLTGVSTLEAVSAGLGFSAELLLNGDTLSGVGTLDVSDQLMIDNTSAGVNGAFQINLTSVANAVTFGADQSLAGFTIDAAAGYITLEEAAISGVSFDFHQATNPEDVVIQSATGTQAWDGSVKASVAGTSTLSLISGTGTLFSDAQVTVAGVLTLGDDFQPDTAANLNNSGVIDISSGGSLMVFSGSDLVNSGTIAVDGGLLYLQAGAFTTTGVVSVTDGTLALSGALNAAQLSSLLTEVKLSGSSLDLQAALDLQGGTLTAGKNGIPSSLLLDGNGTGRLTDGALLVQAGQTVAILNDEYLQVAVVNDGTLTLASGDYSDYGYFEDAVTGTGVMELGTDTNTFRDVQFNAAVGSGQTINFVGSGTANIIFASAAASTSFAGTLNGFAVGDALFLDGETVASAAFKGDAIVATLSTGKTISFATSSALTGHLVVGDGNEIIYQSTPGIQDWSADGSLRDDVPGGARLESWHVANGGLSAAEPWAGDLLVPWHGR